MFTGVKGLAGAFDGCTSLTNINLGNIESIGDATFQYAGIIELFAPNLKEFLQPNTHNKCFSNSKLKHIRCLGNISFIPEGNTNFGCFNNSPLETVILPETLAEIRSFAFRNVTSVVSMNLPKSLERIASLPYGSLADGIDISLPNLMVIDSFAGRGIKRVSNLGSVTSLGVTSGNVEVRGCSNLEFVRLPSTVTSIGVSTFYRCTALLSLYLYLRFFSLF